MSAALNADTSVKRQFVWTYEKQSSFNVLTEGMASPPVIAFPDFERPFVVEADASAMSLGSLVV